MEFSSPLAAMRPAPVAGPWAHRKDLPLFRPAHALNANSFNFKDMSMEKSNSDYFGTKLVRGSSPTVSLAADLSQNFHIDQRYEQLCGPHCGGHSLTMQQSATRNAAQVSVQRLPRT